jgi:hypothetical protein
MSTLVPTYFPPPCHNYMVLMAIIWHLSVGVPMFNNFTGSESAYSSPYAPRLSTFGIDFAGDARNVLGAAKTVGNC